MRILFDHGTPAPLRYELTGHDVATAFERGWSQLANRELLRQAESAFELLITTDKNLKYQQNLSGRKLAILVLSTTSWPRIEKQAAEILACVNAIKPGDFLEFEVP